MHPRIASSSIAFADGIFSVSNRVSRGRGRKSEVPVNLYKDYEKLEIRFENSCWPRKLSTGDSALGQRGAHSDDNNLHCIMSRWAEIVSSVSDLGGIEANAPVGGVDRDRGPASSIRTAYPQVLSC